MLFDPIEVSESVKGKFGSSFYHNIALDHSRESDRTTRTNVAVSLVSTAVKYCFANEYEHAHLLCNDAVGLFSGLFDQIDLEIVPPGDKFAENNESADAYLLALEHWRVAIWLLGEVGFEQPPSLENRLAWINQPALLKTRDKESLDLTLPMRLDQGCLVQVRDFKSKRGGGESPSKTPREFALYLSTEELPSGHPEIANDFDKLLRSLIPRYFRIGFVYPVMTWLRLRSRYVDGKLAPPEEIFPAAYRYAKNVESPFR